MHRRLCKILVVVLLTAWFAVILPGHESPVLSMFDLDGDASEAFINASPAPSHHPNAPEPYQHNAAKCHLCQLASQFCQATPPVPLVQSFLPLNHLYIARPATCIPADVRRTSDPRGPPTAI